MSKNNLSPCCYLYRLPFVGYKLQLGCRRKATVEILSETGDPYNITQSCDSHVGKLLDWSAETHKIWALKEIGE